MMRRSSSLVLHFFATTSGSLLVSTEYSNSLNAELQDCDRWETKQKKENHTGSHSLGEVTLSPYTTLHYLYTIHLFQYWSVLGLSAVILPMSSHRRIHSTLKLLILCYISAFIVTVHTRLFAKAHLDFAHLLLMSLSQKSRVLQMTTLASQSGWIHVVISKNENIRELFLILECNRHTCLKWTLLAGKKFSVPCSICALLDTQHNTKTSHSLLLASGGNSGAGCRPGD